MIGNIANSRGLGSGINVSQLVADLAAASRTPKAERFAALEKTAQARISAVAQARSDLNSFADTLGNLVSTGSLGSQPTTSDNGALAVTALPHAQLGRLATDIEIRQLARAQTSHSGLVASAGDPVGMGGLTLTVAGVAHAITIDAANNSLTGLADAINASGSGINASIVADQGQVRLVLKGETGSAKAFAIDARLLTRLRRRDPKHGCRYPEHEGTVIGGLSVVLARANSEADRMRQIEGILARVADGADYSATELDMTAKAIQRIGLSSDQAIKQVESFVTQGLNPDYLIAFSQGALDLAAVRRCANSLTDSDKLPANICWI